MGTSGHSFLGALADDDQAALRAAGIRRRYRRGATLFTDGDRADSVLLVLDGRVKLSRFDLHGEESVLAIAGPGDLLGEMAAVDGQPRSATGIAIDDVEVSTIPAGELRGLMDRRPAITAAMLRLVTHRLRDSDGKRVEMATQDTLARVATRLVELAERFGEDDDDAIRIALPLSQEELAAWTGSSREAVVKALRTLRDRGLIETARREIRIIDLAGLEKRAAQ